MFDWVKDLWDSFIDFIWIILLSIMDAFKDLFIWFFEQLVDLLIFVVDFSGDSLSSLDITQYLNAIPDETRQILILTGVSDALVILSSALLIRASLNLIPFVKFGS